MAKNKKASEPTEPEAKGGEASEAAELKPANKMKMIIAIAVLAAVIGAGGAIVGIKFLGGSSEKESVQDESAKSDSAAEPGENKEGGLTLGEDGAGLDTIEYQVIDFLPFVVNLSDSGGKRYLKLAMSVEVEHDALGQEINSKMPMFRDSILLLLSSLSYEDISSMDGKMRLRNQMLNRINTNLTSGKIKNIYFSEFVVQ